MEATLKGGRAFAALRVALSPGEWLKAEKNAMIAMSGTLKLSARMDGGLLRSLARRFSGETFFLQEIRATDKAGWVMLAPTAPGAIVQIDLAGKTGITAEKGAFLAATEHVQVSSRVQRPLKGFFGGEGFVLVKITGQGTVFLNGFGAIETVTLLPEQEIMVDNTHLIAWDDTVTYTMGKGGSSWTSAVLAGEGLVARMKGPGRVWMQTRTPHGFADWLTSLQARMKSANS